MQPPFLLVGHTLVLASLGLDIRSHKLKRLLVSRGPSIRSVGAEVDDPHSAGTTRDIEAIHPRNKHVAIRLSVCVRTLQPRYHDFFFDIETPALRVPHESEIGVLQ